MINIFVRGKEFGRVSYSEISEQNLEKINTYILSLGCLPNKDRIFSQVPHLSPAILNALSKGFNTYPVTFDVITKHSRKEIMNLKGIGKKAIDEIDKELKLVDLSYKV